jgi:aspartyl-tRNA(Asn)/glutamyl-tRNA(Gln) amidotransferase subunit A
MTKTTRRILVGLGSLAFLPAYGEVDDPAWLSLGQASLVWKKAAYPVELTGTRLERIERWNPALNASITVPSERALTQARAAEDELQCGHTRGPLHGIPIGLKDNIGTAGLRTAAASALCADRIPVEDADAVGRLLAAGAIMIGNPNRRAWVDTDRRAP